MNCVCKNFKGIALATAIAIPSCFLGKLFPVVGEAVFAILFGMVLALFIKDRTNLEAGIKFTSKKILQWAVILLGFGLDLGVILNTGKQSLPIIVSTIGISLLLAYVLQKVMKIPSKISTLIGVGSSICGGSAVAATAPVIKADDEEIAQAISVIFFFNVLAALIFPTMGTMIGFSTFSGEAFGIFAGTAVNDTSSVTAAASTWDTLYNLGSQTLDKAVTVKLTRTLAIIPITLALSFWFVRKSGEGEGGAQVRIKDIFPFFILYFIAASIITTIAVYCGVDKAFFAPIKIVSKFFIVLSMAAIGMNTNIVKLVKTGGKPLLLGACCWIGITLVSLIMQNMLGLW